MVVTWFLGITSVQQKGPDGTLTVARHQILDNGLLGARVMKSIKKWESAPSNEDTLTISRTFQDGILYLYTTHSATENNHPTYYMNMIFTQNMRQDPKSLGEGLAAIRNAQSWARKQRDASIADANQRLATLSSSATLASSAALGPLRKQALSRNNKPQSNSNKRGIATEDKENIGKRQKRQKN